MKVERPFDLQRCDTAAYDQVFQHVEHSPRGDDGAEVEQCAQR